MPRRGTGRRRQHKYLRPASIARLPPERNSARRPAIKQARRLLARERNRPRPILLDLGLEPRHVDRRGRDLAIHPGARLGEIGEADPELEQACELARLIAPRRDAGLMDRAPEAVAGMGVVVPDLSRARAGGGADEDEAEVGKELVGEFFESGFRQNTFLRIAGALRNLRSTTMNDPASRGVRAGDSKVCGDRYRCALLVRQSSPPHAMCYLMAATRLQAR